MEIRIGDMWYHPEDMTFTKSPGSAGDAACEGGFDRTSSGIRIDVTAPTQLGVLLNDRCNLKCTYCSEDSGRTGGEVGFGTFRTVFDNLVSRYVGRFSQTPGGQPGFDLAITGGGEPTLDWGLFTRVVDHARGTAAACGVHLTVHLTTNAAYMCPEKLDYIADNVDRVLVSYDGLPEVHDRNRPGHVGGSSASVEDAMRHLRSRGKPFSVRTVLAPSDFGRLREMLDRLHLLTGLEDVVWSINPLSPVGRGAGIVSVSETTFYDAFSDVQGYAAERYGFHGIDTPLVAFDEVDVFCGGFGTSAGTPLWLRSDGNLYTCVDCGLDPVGTVVGDRLAFETEYRDVLMEAYLGCYDSAECRSCLAWPICKGGCPAKVVNFGKGSPVRREGCSTLVRAWRAVLEKVVADGECRGWTIAERPGEDRYRLTKAVGPKTSYTRIVLPEWKDGPVPSADGPVHATHGLRVGDNAVVRTGDGRVRCLFGACPGRSPSRPSS